MKDIVSDPGLVAYCGLYCGACGAYLRERCPGCHDNAKATWCKVRSCCITNGHQSCADCSSFTDPATCKKFNNVVAKIFGIVFRSNRAACITQIRKIGLKGHADNMANARRQSIKR